MRILLLSNIFPPGFIGGYELGALDVARGLAARGHTVEVLTSEYYQDDDGVVADLPVHRTLRCVGLSRFPSDAAVWGRDAGFVQPRNLRLIAGLIAKFKPDRILCFNLEGLGVVGILQYLVGLGYRPVLYLMDNVFHNMALDGARRDAFERVFGKSDWLDDVHCIFMSQNLRGEVEGKLGRASSRATLIPGWVDASLSDPDGLVPGERDEGITRFVFASRIAGHKGIGTALQAARLLLDQGHDRFALDIFGGGEVGPMLQLLNALRLGEHLRYGGTPPKKELMRRFRRYDGLVFPTEPREPFGFVAAEAAAAGCVPLMTAGIGAAEWFLDGVDSLKIRNTAEGLAAGMLKLMLMPSGERATMRCRAATTAARFFRFDRALDQLEIVLGAAERDVGAPPATARQARRVEAAMHVLADVWSTEQHG